MKTMLKLAEELVAVLTDRLLPQWKRRQQLACIGSPQDTDLKYLQKWWELVCPTAIFLIFIFFSILTMALEG